MSYQNFKVSITEEFKKVGFQKRSDDPVIVCKLHIPGKAWTLLLYNYSRFESYDEYTGILIEGINVNHFDFLPEHFEQIEQEHGKGIELDTLFESCKVSEL